MYRIIAAITAAQLVASGPAAAAELVDDSRSVRQERGAFAGARIRLPFGARQKVDAGLTLASAQRNASGAVKLSEGVELGVAGGRKLRLSAGGRPADVVSKPKAGVSTTGWVGIGVGTLAVILGIAYLVFQDAVDCSEDPDCT